MDKNMLSLENKKLLKEILKCVTAVYTRSNRTAVGVFLSVRSDHRLTIVRIFLRVFHYRQNARYEGIKGLQESSAGGLAGELTRHLDFLVRGLLNTDAKTPRKQLCFPTGTMTPPKVDGSRFWSFVRRTEPSLSLEIPVVCLSLSVEKNGVLRVCLIQRHPLLHTRLERYRSVDRHYTVSSTRCIGAATVFSHVNFKFCRGLYRVQTSVQKGFPRVDVCAVQAT